MAQAKSQGDSSFPTQGHSAILNKLNSKSKTHRKRTTIDNKNKPQQKHRIGVCVGGGGGGGGEGLKPVLRSNNLILGSAVVHIHIEVVRETR